MGFPGCSFRGINSRSNLSLIFLPYETQPIDVSVFGDLSLLCGEYPALSLLAENQFYKIPCLRLHSECYKISSGEGQMDSHCRLWECKRCHVCLPWKLQVWSLIEPSSFTEKWSTLWKALFFSYDHLQSRISSGLKHPHMHLLPSGGNPF